ncbi:MAG: hypothetical protein JW749_05910 [Sedimentisphaerales bacterium]|nr:hypothetical protein [Sedimentisphaerales bacterium]
MDFNISNPHWIILGPEQSWKTAFEQGCIWGAKEVLYPEWKALDKGNPIFFHVTGNIKGIVGVGIIQTKFIQDKPLWPDEIAIKQVLYPLRFEFSVDYLLPDSDWRKRKISPGLSIQEMRRGINLLQARTVEKLYSAFEREFNHPISLTQPTLNVIATESRKEQLHPPDHSQIQEMIFQIGRMNRLISEKEYPMENERLDVVWRRVERSSPTYAFEIQIGGDLYHALGKLKHAFDLWNSNIFLVVADKEMDKVAPLLAGTFHEIQDKVKILTSEVVSELYTQKKTWVDIEKKVGLL